MKLNFAIMCDNAFTDQQGRLNIIQTFEGLVSPEFPVVYPRLTIVTNYSGEKDDVIGQDYNQLLSIKNKSDKEITKVNLKVPYNGLQNNIQLISYIEGLPFKEDDIGICKVEIKFGKEDYPPLLIKVEKISRTNE